MLRFLANLRLIHQLALPVLLLLVSGLISLTLAARLHATFERQTMAIVDRDSVRLELANKLVAKLLAGALIARDVRLAETPEEVKSIAERNKPLRQEIERDLQQLAGLMDIPEQRQAVADSMAAYLAFEGAIDRTVAAKIESLNAGTPPPAGGKGRLERARLDQLLDQVVAFSEDDMLRAKDQALGTGERATLTVVWGTALARVLALALLVWIAVWQIVRPLDRMSGLMKRLADGDLDIPVEGANRLDEIGTLARALQVFKDNAIKLQSAHAQLAQAKEDAESAYRAAQAANASLESRVVERTAALGAAQEELLRGERLSVLGRITATVAHDLRNPLSTIRNTLFSTRHLPAAQNATFERPLGRIQKAVDRCDRIIQELLDYARPPEAIKVNAAFDAWLEDAIAELGPQSGVTIARDFGAGGATVKFDQDRFHRVIAQLVENAVHALSDPVQPSTLRRIIVRTRVVADRLELVVADTGPGIAPDILPQVFEPLFSTKAYGSGLGLPTVKQIVEQHGGTIEIESEAGAGASVRIVLPCAMPAAQQAA